MKFALDAATNVTFRGERYLHGWISHQFSGQSRQKLYLNARARQFSSFILMVGRIGGADLFLPKMAIIIQNKDDLRILLNLETIPSAKEFKDAIESLSPEQQRFAKAFRGLQLSSTLFGVAVIQIKPQLEKLLKIPDDSLTKEIQLTQDLLKLFIEYQIPSDLLSYAGSESASPNSKIDFVKTQVAMMLKMIDDSKKTEIEEVAQKAVYNVYSSISPPPPPSPHYSAPPPPPSAPGGYPLPSAPPPAMGGGPPPMPSQSIAPPSLSYLSPMKIAHLPTQSYSSHRPVVKSAPPPPSPGPLPSPSPSISAPALSKPKVKKPDAPQGEVQVFAEDIPESVLIDYTKVPTELDAKFEKFDEEGALRPTIINPSKSWTLHYQKALLADPTMRSLDKEAIKKEKSKAFDLLDALSRSGALEIDQAALHIVIASTHCFDKTLMNTLVQDNVNPIERVERSTMLVATTIHNVTAQELLAPAQLERFTTFSGPKLIEEGEKVLALEEAPSESKKVSKKEKKKSATSASSSSKRHKH